MTPADTAKLLTIASMVDNRVIGSETVAEWHRILGHLPFDTAREAMESHFRGSTDYLLPGHIVAIARRAKEMQGNDSTPAALPRGGGWAPKPHNFDAMSRAWNRPAEFQAEVRKYYQQVNDTRGAF